MIPKVIHISWLDKEILFKSKNPLAINGIQNMKRINPTYVIQISDDADVNDYIQSCISNDDWLLLKDRHIVEKTDVWRLLKMWHEGGIYTDIDRLCNIPFDDIIKRSDKCILPTYFTTDFSQDIMIAEKGQDIFKKALELNLYRRRDGCDDVLTLGPITYFHAITLTLTGKQLSRFLPEDEWMSLMKAVQETTGYRAVWERPVADVRGHRTVMYNYNNDYDIGNGGSKEDLYTESKTKHWTSAGNDVIGYKKYGQ
tara:strand:+ start:4115 stop:4879 length:765 start_codon:yes stop_codon:yes gene_type:complete